MAHTEHLARWRESNLESSSQLDRAFDYNELVHDADRSRHVAAWAYEQGSDHFSIKSTIYYFVMVVGNASF